MRDVGMSDIGLMSIDASVADRAASVPQVCEKILEVRRRLSVLEGELIGGWPTSKLYKHDEEVKLSGSLPRAAESVLDIPGLGLDFTITSAL